MSENQISNKSKTKRRGTYPTGTRNVRFASRTHGPREDRVIVTGDRAVARKFNKRVLLTLGGSVAALALGNAVKDNYEPSPFNVDTEQIATLSPEEVSANYELLRPEPGLGLEAIARDYFEAHDLKGDDTFRDIVEALESQAAEHDGGEYDQVIQDHDTFYLTSHPEDL